MLNLGNKKDAARYFGLRRAEAANLVSMHEPDEPFRMRAWVICKREYGDSPHRKWLDAPEAELCDMPDWMVQMSLAKGWGDERLRDVYYAELREFAAKVSAIGVVLFFKAKYGPRDSGRRPEQQGLMCVVEHDGRHEMWIADVDPAAGGRSSCSEWRRMVDKDASPVPPELRILP